MPSNFRTGSIDLDDIFMSRDPDTSPLPATNYKVGGTDLSDRYEPYIAGAQFNVAFKKAGTLSRSGFFKNQEVEDFVAPR
jgi:hypothetical protein